MKSVNANMYLRGTESPRFRLRRGLNSTLDWLPGINLMDLINSESNSLDRIADFLPAFLGISLGSA